jgi:hypothetical protein
MILQENVLIKVEKDPQGLSEEEHASDMKRQSVYVPSVVAIKTEPEVRLAHCFCHCYCTFVQVLFPGLKCLRNSYEIVCLFCMI